MGMNSESKLRAINKYNKERTVQICLRFFKTTDADVIDHLRKQENKTDYVRRLIRTDMQERPE